MKVKMLTSMAGMNFSHHPGQIVDLGEKQARARIAAGHAEEVLEAAAAKHETEQTIARAKAREAELQGKIDKLEMRLARVEDSNGKLRETNKGLRKDVSGLKQERSDLSDKLGRAERLLNQLRATADDAEAQDSQDA